MLDIQHELLSEYHRNTFRHLTLSSPLQLHWKHTNILRVIITKSLDGRGHMTRCREQVGALGHVWELWQNWHPFNNWKRQRMRKIRGTNTQTQEVMHNKANRRPCNTSWPLENYTLICGTGKNIYTRHNQTKYNWTAENVSGDNCITARAPGTSS